MRTNTTNTHVTQVNLEKSAMDFQVLTAMSAEESLTRSPTLRDITLSTAMKPRKFISIAQHLAVVINIIAMTLFNVISYKYMGLTAQKNLIHTIVLICSPTNWNPVIDRSSTWLSYITTCKLNSLSDWSSHFG